MTLLARVGSLGELLPLGWELSTGPDVVQRWDDALDLPGPIQGVAPPDGPITVAWCPHCLEPVDGWEYAGLFARRQQPRTELHVAALLTLPACGHAFRIMRGQTIFDIRRMRY
ncbi:hypothetical protein [Streptomyces sp. NPDC007905]|uniref:hypothetical protein n=1 Tax=Streptomyces sp. NPDC007905 TaxID=3364788 RepID=UPI0036E31878